MTKKEMLKRYKKRVSVLLKTLAKLGAVRHFFTPNDDPHNLDVAFGLLTDNTFIAATDFTNIDLNRTGDITHISMLQALGKENPDILETELNRNQRNTIVKNYITRGIVKKSKSVIAFWESANDLIEDDHIYKGAVKCLQELRKRKLIKGNMKIYGTENPMDLGTVSEFLNLKDE